MKVSPLQIDLLSRFGVIVADPPWAYEDDGIRGGVAHHYPTMSPSQIMAMPVIDLVCDHAALYLWITNAMLLEGVGARVARAWGFDPKTVLTWDKKKMGTGRTFRGRTEHVVFATRGIPSFPLHNLTTMMDQLPPRSSKHSEKPEEFFDLALKATPQGPHLEMFARAEPRPGWSMWGNQAREGISLPQLDRAITRAA